MVVKVLIESLHKNLSLNFFLNTAIKSHVCSELPVEIWSGEANLHFYVGTPIVAHLYPPQPLRKNAQRRKNIDIFTSRGWVTKYDTIRYLALF